MPSPPTSARGAAIRERILIFGDSGSGKTRALLSVAKWHQQRKSPAQFHVIDNDMAYERMLAGADFGDLTNVIPYDVDTWPDYVDAIDKVRAAVDPDRGDWAGIDLLDRAWDEAQNEFARRVYGEELDDYWLTARHADGEMSGTPIDGWDWGIINKMYRKNIERFILRAPCHLLCVTAEKDLAQQSKSGKGGEDTQTLTTFGRLGVKPAGQKMTAYQFHTVIRFTQSKKGWLMTAAKDREREMVRGAEIGNFWHPYLVKVAGWSM